MRFLKEKIKETFRYFGYEIKKNSNSNVLEYDLWVWLKKTQSIKTIIDIGANNGDFARFLSEYFGASSVYAFEPLPEMEDSIKKNLSGIPSVSVFSVALSDSNGENLFYQNSYGPASSMLRVARASKEEFPQTAGETSVNVKVVRLDDIIDASQLKKDVFIKIDVQGVEDRVIEGGRKVFAQAKCVLIEMSFIPMYEDQALFEEVHSLLVDLGYRFSGVKNQINSEKTGQPLFCHCLYVKR